MTPRGERLYPYLPEVGCALLLATLVTMCVLPYLFVGAMQAALANLHLSPVAAMLILIGIFLGSLINIPIRYVEREVEQTVVVRGWSGWMNRSPLLRRGPTETLIAINVGGCAIPVLLALFEVVIVLGQGRQVAWSAAVATLINILVCYYAARPVAGVGIALPVFLSPAVAIGLTWLLLMPLEYEVVRPPVAFIAGVLGPVIGADLLHLRDFTRISVGVLSIGGAGTFDGIVLSGMVAALLA